jgi:hypothetical protein
MLQGLLVEAGTPQSRLACQPNRLHRDSEIGMNISRATPAFAEQLPIHIADASPARSGPSVNTEEEGLRH